MARHALAKLLGLVRGAAAGDGVSDAQLLERFAGAGDEAAFELLVRRHARLVLGVCRRALHDEHAAEDAFQATFLALARKAASISRREAVASWLYKVAYRAALAVRADRCRHATRARPLAAAADVPAPPQAVQPVEQRELRAVLDEEVGRLPEKLRAPVVLCYLEGKTVAEAAGQLGCPHGTVASRLARARRRLRRRLSRRGLAAPALLPGAGAAVPEVLVRSALRTARAGVGAVPARVAAVTERVLRAMFLRKLVTGALILTAFVSAFVGGRLLVPAPAGVAAGAEPPEEKDQPAKPIAVTVTRPVERMRAPFLDFTGRLEAGQVVQIRAQVSGPLLKVVFKDGAEVKKGDLLFEIDPRPFQAEVDQAKANLVVTEVKRQQAVRKLQRVKQAANAVPQSELDGAAAAAEVADAEYKVAQAALDVARLTLDHTRVTAPMDGTMSRHLLDPGNLVTGGPGATHLATLSSQDPLGVSFDMDERSFLRYRQLVRDGQVKGEGGPLSVGLADEEGFPHEGTLASFDNQVSPASGIVPVRGTLPNPGRRLVPGLFARVRIPFGKPRRVLEVPEAALGSDQGKRFVWVVNDRNVVDRREVKVGPADDKMRVIEEGLGADDWVVIDGMAGLKAGDRVEPRRAKPPRGKAPGGD
jgi:RND family efflux transporter MFP subunit